MTKRPTKTAAGSGRPMPERMPGGATALHRPDDGPALSDELRGSPPRHGLTLKEATSRLEAREVASTFPATPAGAGVPTVPDDERNVRRSARALVPILADGELYLPGTDREMVPLTFEAYGELVAARLIEPVPWESLEQVLAPGALMSREQMP